MGCGASSGSAQTENVNNSGGANPGDKETVKSEEQVPCLLSLCFQDLSERLFQ